MFKVRVTSTVGVGVFVFGSVSQAVAKAKTFSSGNLKIFNEFGRELSIRELQKALSEGK